MYSGIENEDHLLRLIDREPPWDFFLYQEVTDQLFHLKGHSDLLVRYKPTSVEDLAMILAIIRPSKSYLKNSPWEEIQKKVWEKEVMSSYQFKRGHGIAYAIAIVVNLNLLIERMEKD
jgi:hypothetical protein